MTLRLTIRAVSRSTGAKIHQTPESLLYRSCRHSSSTGQAIPTAIAARLAGQNQETRWRGCLAVAGAAGALAAAASQPREPAGATSAYSIPIGPDHPRTVNCFVEVSRGSRMKYEWDDDIDMLKLDRVLSTASMYPQDYGFIPQTLCGDGDPLDVLILGSSALQPGSIVDVRPLGYMIMEDEKGLDEKVLAVPSKDPRFEEILSLRDVPDHYLREISHFFETYKALEREKWVKVGGWKGTADTHKLIETTHEQYLKKKQGGKATAAKAAPSQGKGGELKTAPTKGGPIKPQEKNAGPVQVKAVS